MIALAINAQASGYRPLYRSGCHCPSCASSAWIIGRRSAECARCSTALPLAPTEPELPFLPESTNCGGLR